MQATKQQQQQQHSPGSKQAANNQKSTKITISTINGNGNGNCNTNTSDQISMVKTSASNNLGNTISNNNNNHNNLITKPILKSSCSSNNSIENDQEVEEITNNAAKLDITSMASTSSSTSSSLFNSNRNLIATNTSNNDQNNNNNTKKGGAKPIMGSSQSATATATPPGKQPQGSESPQNLLLDDTTTTTTSKTTFLSANNTQTIPCSNEGLVAVESVFMQQQQQQSLGLKSSNVTVSGVVAKQQTTVAPGSSQGAQMDNEQHLAARSRDVGDNPKNDIVLGGDKEQDARISLDTKVPHPLKNDFHMLASEQQLHHERQQHQEEVSYYNDHAASALFEPRAGGSLDNNARPRLLAASKEQKSISQVLPRPTSSCHQLQQQQQQQQHQKNQQHQFVLHQTNQQPCRQPSEREYLNDVEEDYDECDPRYHNAAVERKILRQSLEDHEAIDQLYECGAMSTPTSPKAKSAPATPCNATPIAFHQHTAHQVDPNPANTLPTDIRKSNQGQSATSRLLLANSSLASKPLVSSSSSSSVQFLDKLIKQGEIAFNDGKYQEAIHSFTQCIELAKNNLPGEQSMLYLKKNFRVYSLRAEAHFQIRYYPEAIEDSMAARDLNPKWTQAYYLQGQSQFLLGQYASSLAVFSFGLAQDPTNTELFEVLVESALKSRFQQQQQQKFFEPKYEQLKVLGLEKKPFVVVSLLGQELLALGHGEQAAVILESALKLEGASENRKFRGSVLSTIALACCLMKDYERAITYMHKELDVESELEDISGQCRVLSNLGYTYFKMRKYDKSLEVHRKQLNLAMKTHLFQQASMALNALGHVHAARCDYSNALTSHTRCLDILKQLGDNHFSQYKEMLSIGHMHSMLGEFDTAEEKYNQAVAFLRQNKTTSTSSSGSVVVQSGRINLEDYHVGLIMVKHNMAYVMLRRQQYHEAIRYYSDIVGLAQKLGQRHRGALYEMRAAGGLAHAYRLYKDFENARAWFDKQLQLARELNDEVGQSQALSSLGLTWLHFKDYTCAEFHFEQNMKLVERNPLLKAYAHSYLGSIEFLKGHYVEAQAHYENSSNLFKDLDYCSNEKKTIDLNMAFVHERMGHHHPPQPLAAAAGAAGATHHQLGAGNVTSPASHHITTTTTTTTMGHQTSSSQPSKKVMMAA